MGAHDVGCGIAPGAARFVGGDGSIVRVAARITRTIRGRSGAITHRVGRVLRRTADRELAPGRDVALEARATCARLVEVASVALVGTERA